MIDFKKTWKAQKAKAIANNLEKDGCKVISIAISPANGKYVIFYSK